MLRFFQGVMHGQPVEIAGVVASGAVGQTSSRQRRRGQSGMLPDLRIGELAVLLPLLILIVYLGFAPGVLTTSMESTVTHMVPTFATTPPTTTRTSPPALRWERGPGGEVRTSPPPSPVGKWAGELGSANARVLGSEGGAPWL
jgi:hypothetical protein